MDIEAKKQEIITALRTKEVTQRDIDNSDCRATSRMLRGEWVGESPTVRVYAKLENIRQNGGLAKATRKARAGKESAKATVGLTASLQNSQDTKTIPLDQKPLDKELDNHRIEIDGILAKNQELERKVSELSKRVKYLEGVSNRLPNPLGSQLGKKSDSNHCLGFQLVLKNVKGHPYWYGVKALKGKVVWVYVGSLPEKATVKIQEWLKRNPETAANCKNI